MTSPVLHRITFQDRVTVVVDVYATSRDEAETLAWERVSFPHIPPGMDGDLTGDWDIVPEHDPDPRDTQHVFCDCVPTLGPPHCHLCGQTGNSPVPYDQCPVLGQAVAYDRQQQRRTS